MFICNELGSKQQLTAHRKEERSTLITSLFYSKLYYGSEVWHLPERTACQNKMIKCASANALRIITNEITIFHTHSQIHAITGRALPDQMIKSKHALLLYKLMRQCMPSKESIQMNFQANLNERQVHHNFIKMQNYSVGNNILLNRLCILNNEIPKLMTNDSYDTFKVKCKKQFLTTINWRTHKLQLLGTKKAPYDHCQTMPHYFSLFHYLNPR